MTKNEEIAILERYRRRKEQGKVSSVFTPAYQHALYTMEREYLARLKRYGMTDIQDKKILDVGCGDGGWLRRLVSYGADPANLSGIDLLEERVASARQLSPHISVQQCNAENIPFPDRHFDIVMQMVVFTSILDYATKERIAEEMLRVLKDDGVIMWFDFRYNNPWNPDVKGIKKNELLSLFKGCVFDFKSIELAPPITKLLARYSIAACCMLEKIPLLRTHYLTIIRKQP